MPSYSIEPRTRKYIKGYGSFHLQEIYPTNMGKKLLDTVTRTEIDAARPVSEKVVHKTAERTGDFIENKIAENKPKPMPDANSRNVEKISIPPEKR